MQYMILFKEEECGGVYKKPNYDEIIKEAQPCYKLDISDLKTFRLVKDGKTYSLEKQYTFFEKALSVYVFNETWY